MKTARYQQCTKCHRIVEITWYKTINVHTPHFDYDNWNATVKCYDSEFYNSDPIYGDHQNKLE